MEIPPPPSPVLGVKRSYVKCPHGRHKTQCKDCGFTYIRPKCPHGSLRHQCKDCDGASVCAHGRRRTQCKACGGATICEHGNKRNVCVPCGGASICSHMKVRIVCHECSNFVCDIASCPKFGHRFAGKRSLHRHMTTYHSDSRQTEDPVGPQLVQTWTS